MQKLTFRSILLFLAVPPILDVGFDFSELLTEQKTFLEQTLADISSSFIQSTVSSCTAGAKYRLEIRCRISHPSQAFKSLRDKVHSLKNKMAEVLLFRLRFFTNLVMFLFAFFIYTRVLFQGMWEVAFFYCTEF